MLVSSRRRYGLLRRCSDTRDAGRGGPTPQHVPDVKLRVVNVVDVTTLEPPSSTRMDFRIMNSTHSSHEQAGRIAYHGYPWLIHRLTYRRTNHDNLHVRGIRRKAPPPHRSI